MSGRVGAIRTCGIAIVVALFTLGCSSGNDPAAMSMETADVQCGLVADAYEHIARSRNLLDSAAGAEGLESLRSVVEAVEGTELSTLLQLSVAASAARAEGDASDSREWASVVLEARRAQAAVGLWCIEHTSVEVSVDLALRFLEPM
ncbi:MAG: hypothetical protein R8F63_15740 [Acidimicrobiales bacterium]|nr:hypothetical protein [Acidimicrobiales bacterium]